MSLLLPQYERAVSRWLMPLGFGELAFMFWLLVMGAKSATARESSHPG
jgi:hypothetical protein